ncbi:MAG: NADH-quinone oxidoreductase subunit A [Elusimicrobia bacterium]|nr:NADH-quinone oxidoreductase subunit A [Elusimicrobiota bacterium]
MTGFALLFNVLLVGATVAAFLLAGWFLGPRPKHQGDAELPYETGLKPLSEPGRAMAALYWRYAVLFVAFDVDLALLMPWALTRPVLELSLMVSVTVFIGLLAFMLLYFWRKGTLECN